MRPRQVPFSLTLLLICALLGAPFAAATTWFVDASNTSGTETGTSAHPYSTIQRALNQALPGDLVQVRPGLYQEVIGVPAGVILMGQCTPATPCDPNILCVRRRSTLELDPNNASIIDGQAAGSVVNINAALATTVVDGFTITGGRSASSFQGGGFSIIGNPLICNNIISGNRAVGGTSFESFGGGIRVSGNAIIQDNLIFGNTAVGGHGGGIAITGGAPVVTRNEIRGNSALADLDGFSGYGGGIAVTVGVGEAVVTSNVIYGNSADQGGGGVDVYRSQPTIAGNTIEANRAGQAGRDIGHGGGIAVTGQRNLVSSTRPIIMNNLILRNEATVSGGGIDVVFGKPYLLSNNLYGNTPLNFRGKKGPAATDGNVSTDPNLPSPFTTPLPGSGFPHVEAGHGELVVLDDDLSSDPNVIGDRRVRRLGSIGPLDFFHRLRTLDGDQDGDQPGGEALPDIGAAELLPGSDPGLPGIDPNGIDFDDLDGDDHLDADPNTDNCPAVYNFAQIDSDADRVGDPCDNCPLRRNGACDADPNSPDYDPSLDPLCALDPNTGITDRDREFGRQHDADGDGVGDACDADRDNDGVLEDQNFDGVEGGASVCYGKKKSSCDDNCPLDFNENQRDRDGDGVGDVCDNCFLRRNGFCDEIDSGMPDPKDRFCDINKNGSLTPEERLVGRQLDTDGDGVGDACDNCPTVPNGNCLEANACDVNNDGVLSGIEISRGGQSDRDGDKIGDACEVDFDNDKIPCHLEPLTTIDPNAPAGREIVMCDVAVPPTCVVGVGTGCEDNCPDQKNVTQVDTDSDGVGDTCDNCDMTPNGPCDADPNAPGSDPTKDLLCDANGDGMLTDEERAEGRQLNTDGDAEGDACDADDDGDGALDDGDSSGVIGDNPCPGPDPNTPSAGCDDNCRLITNSAQEDLDNDGMGDPCDDDADGDGVPNRDSGGSGAIGDPDGDGVPTGDPNSPAPPGDPDADGVPTDGNPNSPTARPCEGPFDPSHPCDDNCPTIYNPSQSDADDDGLGDACDDNCPTIYNPSQSDVDNDHAGDACDDNCAADYNPGQEDMDGDTIGDKCDNCEGVSNIFQQNRDQFADPNNEDPLGDDCDPDPDGDEDPNTPIVDNCPDLYNPAQSDVDADLIGDDCDICPNDYNPAQADLDRDGLGDECDPDDDDDTIRDARDNCPLVPNPLQTDRDKDGLGDACDADADGDLVADDSDNCPGLYNPAQTDTDGDTLGDTCDLCPDLSTPVNTDGDADGTGDPCDPVKVKPTAIDGPAVVTLGGPTQIYTVTFTNLDPWNGTLDYTIRLRDPSGGLTTLAGDTGAAIPASGMLSIDVSASFPAGGRPGQWAVDAEASATGSSDVRRLRKNVNAS